MKKILFGLRNLLKPYLLQFLLAVVGYDSFQRIISLSHKTTVAKGEAGRVMDLDSGNLIGTGVPLDVAITSGYNGAALAAGLVCSTCIVMIVWIEVKKISALSN